MPYEFTQDDFMKFQQAVLEAGGDQASLTGILTDFQDTMISAMGIVENAVQENAQLKDENSRLEKSNKDLFFRVGETVRQQQAQESRGFGLAEAPEAQTVAEYLDAWFEARKERKGVMYG